MAGAETVKLLAQRVRDEVAAELSLRDLSDEEVETLIEKTARYHLPDAGEDEVMSHVKAISDEFLRFGPLQALIEDPDVSEIMVNGGGRDPETGAFLAPQVFVEVRGVNRPCPAVAFESEEHLVRIVSRIARRAGRLCDETHPTMDAQLPDGSRVNAVHHSVSIDGQSLNIRKFKRGAMTPEQLVDGGSCSPSMMEFLRSCVIARASIVVSGGTGSGKTTMLNALSSFIPEGERIVVIEDTAELRLAHGHIVRLQARPRNAEGSGEVTVHDLVVNALRMRPDRIVVGECRSDETIEMLQAMQTGHDGSLTTVHANSALGVFSRIETMVMASQPLDSHSIKQQISEAVDLVVHTKRLESGRRVIEEIVSVDGCSDGVISHTTLFSCSVGDGPGARFAPNAVQPQKIKQLILDAGAPYRAEWFFEEGGY